MTKQGYISLVQGERHFDAGGGEQGRCVHIAAYHQSGNAVYMVRVIDCMGCSFQKYTSPFLDSTTSHALTTQLHTQYNGLLSRPLSQTPIKRKPNLLPELISNMRSDIGVIVQDLREISRPAFFSSWSELEA